VTDPTSVALATRLAKRYGPRVRLDGLNAVPPVSCGFRGPTARARRHEEDSHRPRPRRRGPGRAARAPFGRGAGRACSRGVDDRGSVLLPVPVRSRDLRHSRRPARPRARPHRRAARAGQPRPTGPATGLWGIAGHEAGWGSRRAAVDPKCCYSTRRPTAWTRRNRGDADKLRAFAASGMTCVVSASSVRGPGSSRTCGIIARGRLVREGTIDDLLRAVGAVGCGSNPAEVATARPSSRASRADGAVAGVDGTGRVAGGGASTPTGRRSSTGHGRGRGVTRPGSWAAPRRVVFIGVTGSRPRRRRREGEPVSLAGDLGRRPGPPAERGVV